MSTVIMFTVPRAPYPPLQMIFYGKQGHLEGTVPVLTDNFGAIALTKDIFGRLPVLLIGLTPTSMHLEKRFHFSLLPSL
jgi:hypothetical protein